MESISFFEWWIMYGLLGVSLTACALTSRSSEPAATPVLVPPKLTHEPAILQGEIETQFDLARAYIDMGDFAAAENLLKDIRETGGESQKREATELLNECYKK
jgi:FimV-like protein